VTRTFRGLAIGVSAMLAAGACAGSGQQTSKNAEPSDRPTVVVTAQPQDPQSARVTVEQAFSLLAGGDWAGVWELWTEAAQAALPKDAYVNLIATCPLQGRAYQVTDVKAVDANTTTVNWKRQNVNGAEEAGSTTARYEAGTWHVEPDPAALAAYKRGACS
jgi:hypothetical protein